MALDLVDPLKDAARVVRDIRRAVFREAAEKAGRRRSHNDEAKERDAPHGPPQMLPGAAHWIGSPEQLPAGGGLPVDRTCLLEGGLYVSSCARRCGQNWAPRAAFFGLLVGAANTRTWDFLRGCKLQSRAISQKKYSSN